MFDIVEKIMKTISEEECLLYYGDKADLLNLLEKLPYEELYEIYENRKKI